MLKPFISTSHDLVLIIVPVFNHSDTLGKVLSELSALSLPLLVVNDGSTDGIDKVMKKYSELNWISHEVNLGKGQALLSGMEWALDHGYRAVITFDADGQHIAEDVPRFIEEWVKDTRYNLIGHRDFKAQASGAVPLASKIGRFWSNFFVCIETGQYVADTQAGLRLYVLDRDLLHSIKARRYHFEVEILVRGIWRGQKVKNFPMKVYYPEADRRLSHYLKWTDTWRMVGLHVKPLGLGFIRLCGFKL